MKHRDGRSLDHKALEDIRVGVVERVQAGESPEDVICTLGFSRSCIYAWLARYRQGGWEALKTPRLKGRPLKIQAAQMRWLCRTIVGKSPLQFRFEFALWTREMIAVLLWEKFQLRLRLVSITRLLRQLGLSCQRPLWGAWEQDSEGVRRRLAEEYPAIRAQARRAGAEIYWGDEAGARSDYHGGTTWGLQGQTPVARRTGGRSAVNMLSAISTRGPRGVTRSARTPAVCAGPAAQAAEAALDRAHVLPGPGHPVRSLVSRIVSCLLTSEPINNAGLQP